MRYAWLLLLLALPASAQEFQFDAVSNKLLPFTMSFDFNAASGNQSYDFNYGCVDNFVAVVPITNLSVTVNGAPFPFAASSMSLDGSGLGPICGGSINVLQLGSITTNYFYSEIDRAPLKSLGTYPLVTLLNYLGTGSDPVLVINGVIPGVELTDVTWTATSVPEPGTLGLLTFAFAGLLVFHGRRRVHSER
jgi:PEP-CTERM motif-containing protein